MITDEIVYTETYLEIWHEILHVCSKPASQLYLHVNQKSDIYIYIYITEFGNWIMLGLGLCGRAKGNSHNFMGKGHRTGASCLVYS